MSEDKSFDVEIGTPTNISITRQRIGRREKGSGTPKATKVGNLTPESIVKIAQMKSPDSLREESQDRCQER